jgi:hypothetical protein
MEVLMVSGGLGAQESEAARDAEAAEEGGIGLTAGLELGFAMSWIKP